MQKTNAGALPHWLTTDNAVLFYHGCLRTGLLTGIGDI